MNYDIYESLSVQDFFAILRNRMEERVLKNKLGSIELEEKRLLRRYRSETRLLKMKQEQRLGNLVLKRVDSNGVQLNKGSLNPQSEGKPWFTSSQSLKYIHVCDSLSDRDNAFSIDEECSQHMRRLPRLPSRDNMKTQEPMSPASPRTCQSPVNRKSAGTCQSPINRQFEWIPPVFVEDDVKSPDSQSSLGKEGRENNEATTTFVTQLQRKQCVIPRLRCKTWNGKPLPAAELLSGRDTPRNRSFSEEDERANNLRDLTTGTSHEAQFEDTFVSDLKTACKKHSGLTKMGFPTAEDVQCRNLLFPPPYFPLRKSNSLNSLKSLDVLPPVFQDQKSPTANQNTEAANQAEEMSDTCQLLGNGRETNIHQQGTVCHSGPVCLLKRRRPPPIKQEHVLEDGSSNNAACVCSESPRYDGSSTGVTGKVSGKCKASLALNGMEQGQEKKTSKFASGRRGKFTASSRSLSSQRLAQFSEEDVLRVETTKRKVSVRRRGTQGSLAAKEKELPEDMKAKWMKAMKKVFNVNMILNGMVALQKQRELEKLALEQKQAALEKLYEDLKHCRYLRLPSNEDDSQQHDFVTWVFDKK